MLIKPLPLTIIMLTKNEADNLVRSLPPLQGLAEQLLVIDSGSDDDTVAIAKQFGAEVVIEPWRGYAEQKNFALQHAKQPWILFIDADEVLSPETMKGVHNIITQEKPVIATIHRKTVYINKVMHFAWQPDSPIRLCHTIFAPKWQGHYVHEHLEFSSIPPIEHLPGIVYHYSYRNIAEHFRKSVHYAQLAAQQMYEQGVTFKRYFLVINPLTAFVKQYIIKQGWRDGIRGFAAAFSSGFSTWLKYIILWEIMQKKPENDSIKE